MSKIKFRFVIIAVFLCVIALLGNYLYPRYVWHSRGYEKEEINYLVDQEKPVQEEIASYGFIEGLLEWSQSTHYDRYPLYTSYQQVAPELSSEEIIAAVDFVLDHGEVFVFSDMATLPNFLSQYSLTELQDYCAKHQDDTFLPTFNLSDVVSRDTLPLSISFQPPVLEECCLPSTENEVWMMDQRANQALQEMALAAASEGYILYNNSSYRSYEQQQAIYEEYLDLYGESYVDKYVGLHGHSEHQTGLAIDLSCETVVLGEAMTLYDTKAYDWLLANCADYGFILRYPEGKEDITHTSFEPWHYRYVGVEVAQEIMEKGLTLEEFNAKPF